MQRDDCLLSSLCRFQLPFRPHIGACTAVQQTVQHHPLEAMQLLGQSCVRVWEGGRAGCWPCPGLDITALTLVPRACAGPHSRGPGQGSGTWGRGGRGLRLPSSFSVEGLSGSPCSSQSWALWVVTGTAHLSWAAQEPEERGLSLVLRSLPLKVAGLCSCPLRMTTPSRQSPFLPTLHPGGLVTTLSSGIWRERC